MFTIQQSGLGSVPSSNFRCPVVSTFGPVCSGRNATTERQFTDLQRAIDSFVNILPLFVQEIPREISDRFEQVFDSVAQILNPIGTLEGRAAFGKGYDGDIGPLTTKYGQVALIGALDLLRAAGIVTPPENIAFLARRPPTPNWAAAADEATDFLRSVTTRFDALLAQAKQRAAEAGVILPVTLAPPPVTAAERQALRPRKRGAGLVVGGAMAAAGLIGLGAAAWNMRKKPPLLPTEVF